MEEHPCRILTTRVVLLEIGNALSRHRYRHAAIARAARTDCNSFLVMEERNLADALTADAHFPQAGFRALLLEQ
jgi:hypothetical protein